jgi:toxin ParE1/3/4
VRRLIIAPDVKADIAAIGRYSRRQWGAEQARFYSRAIAERIFQLRERPDLGHRRPDVDAQVRCLKSGRHLIFYDVTETDLTVLRVLHERQDAPGHVASGRRGLAASGNSEEP